ncbi:putative glcG protein [Ketogulonicigenium robustum]|uniref:Putative glcG protein n=1 Tax=Ketogulonicigenium robustum TaxID=92947 RepID=A0A1W6P104_9RHOB|nr:heme-binding protein [Ketogulonicigenium robustum]ARO15192.1 putative glcG protein [Ketogulonicigenium robustum]
MKSILRLDIDDARILIAGANAAADEIGVPMCIAIMDEGANLLAFERMEGGKVSSSTIAIDKAFTAAAAKRATHEYGAASQPGAPAYGINSAIGGRLMIVAGGVPVVHEGEVIGAIGISSGTPAQDRAVAEAAIAHWLAR